MKKIILITLLFSATILPAREVNPINPDFNHDICLNNRSVNPAAGQTGANKREALESLAKMKSFNVEQQAMYNQLHPAYRAYYNKLSSSLRSDGRKLSSFELDRQLDLSGDCDGVNSVLLDIINNLK